MNKTRARLIVKMAKERSDSKAKNYIAAAAATAPMFAAKTVADFPRNLLKKKLEVKLTQMSAPKGPKAPKMPKPPKVKGLSKSLRSAAKMTLLGGATGIATAPIFLKGVELASSNKKEDRIKGIGMIAGSGAVFQGMKGLGEGGLPRALSRITVKAPSSIALGLALGQSRKEEGKDKYIKPLLIASAGGAVQGAVDKIYETAMKAPKGKRLKALKGFGSVKGLKSTLPFAGAGAASGAIGGLISALVVDKALKKLKEKKNTPSGGKG